MEQVLTVHFQDRSGTQNHELAGKCVPSTCPCKVCTDTRRWQAAMPTPEATAVLDEVMERLAMAETDVTYWRLKYEGKWPGDAVSDESVESA